MQKKADKLILKLQLILNSAYWHQTKPIPEGVGFCYH
jgi:hypothetical protein